MRGKNLWCLRDGKTDQNTLVSSINIATVIAKQVKVHVLL
jgi:hypothetical protein